MWPCIAIYMAIYDDRLSSRIYPEANATSYQSYVATREGHFVKISMHSGRGHQDDGQKFWKKIQSIFGHRWSFLVLDSPGYDQDSPSEPRDRKNKKLKNLCDMIGQSKHEVGHGTVLEL